MRIRISMPRIVRRLVQAAAALLLMAGLGALPLAALSGEDTIASPLAEGRTPSFDAVAYDCSSQSQIPQTECEALVALYNSTGGPSWTHNTNWLATVEPCGWYAVGCSAGSVGTIGLPENNLVGTIPSQLGNLNGLWFLRLDANQLSGPIPATIGNLGRLQTLQLDSNKLTGQIPAALGNLSELQWLRLHSNHLSGAIPVTLASLSKLRYLDLTENWRA